MRRGASQRGVAWRGVAWRGVQRTGRNLERVPLAPLRIEFYGIRLIYARETAAKGSSQAANESQGVFLVQDGKPADSHCSR